LTNKDNNYSEAEAAARRDAVVKHMLGKPPQPHSEMKIGKRSERKIKDDASEKKR
jgi:hypothetical protein